MSFCLPFNFLTCAILLSHSVLFCLPLRTNAKSVPNFRGNYIAKPQRERRVKQSNLKWLYIKDSEAL